MISIKEKYVVTMTNYEYIRIYIINTPLELTSVNS